MFLRIVSSSLAVAIGLIGGAIIASPAAPVARALRTYDVQVQPRTANTAIGVTASDVASMLATAAHVHAEEAAAPVKPYAAPQPRKRGPMIWHCDATIRQSQIGGTYRDCRWIAK